MSHTEQTLKSLRRQRGLGIIEVLVALVIVSLGVLGMANLQLKGMKHSSSGYNRAKALLTAENISSRMRVNSTGVLDGAYDGFDSSALNCDLKPNPYCQVSTGVAAQSCNTTELAEFDLFSVACGDWGNATTKAVGGVDDLLPNGSKLEINCDDTPCTANSTYTIAVSWPEGLTSSSNTQVDRRVQMRLRP